jgi:hypothetical protein
MKMEVIVATTKNVADAAVEEPRYLEAELFMGRYTDRITPIKNATIMNVDVCIVSFLCRNVSAKLL